MSLTNFPNGISSFGMPQFGIGEETMTTGNIFFVDSGNGSDTAGANGLDPASPFATIDYAIGQCTGNNGDIIFVMPGHGEQPATTEGIDMDVQGVWVRGLGWGLDRPKIQPENATVGIKMAAASCRISNIRFGLGTTTATVAAAVSISATSCTVEGCSVEPHASSEYTSLIGISFASSAVIRNNVLRCLSTGASSTSGILLDGSDQVQITGNLIDGFFAEHAIDNTTGSLDQILDVLIANNYIKNSGSGVDLVIDMDADATGLIISNMMSGEQALDANYIGGNCRSINNWMADVDDARAVGIPVTSAV